MSTVNITSVLSRHAHDVDGTFFNQKTGLLKVIFHDLFFTKGVCFTDGTYCYHYLSFTTWYLVVFILQSKTVMFSIVLYKITLSFI